MKKLTILLALLLFVGFASTVQAQVGDVRANVHLYSVDDSVQDRSTAGLPGTVSNTWKIVTTATDTSETYNIGSFTNFTLIARVDSINAADSAEFVIAPYVSNDTLTWAFVGDSLLVKWGTVIAPVRYYKTFTTIRGLYLRFLINGQGGNDSCHVYLSLFKQQ